MSTAGTRRRADESPSPNTRPPGGAPTPHPTAQGRSTTKSAASGGVPTSRQAVSDAAPVASSPAGANSHPTHVGATTKVPASGGAQLAGRHTGLDSQMKSAASNQHTDRRMPCGAPTPLAVGAEAGPGPAADTPTTTRDASLLDPALALAADVLDDLERVRIANENRLRQLTRSAEDADGETRGFGLDEAHPDVARLAALVDTLRKVEHDATLNLQRHMRRHPLGPWAKSIRGAGDKQVARLLAVIGDPYIRPEIVRDDGTALPEGPRTVSALWAYAGLHVLPASVQSTHDAHVGIDAGRIQPPADGGRGGDPVHASTDPLEQRAGVAPRRKRGQLANWSGKAKTRAYLISLSCLKQLVKPCHNPADGLTVHVEGCACSPYRVVYDTRRAHTAVTRPDWTDGHSHNDALRVSAKAFLRDMWREAKRIHESAAEEATS